MSVDGAESELMQATAMADQSQHIFLDATRLFAEDPSPETMWRLRATGAILEQATRVTFGAVIEDEFVADDQQTASLSTVFYGTLKMINEGLRANAPNAKLDDRKQHSQALATKIDEARDKQLDPIVFQYWLAEQFHGDIEVNVANFLDSLQSPVDNPELGLLQKLGANAVLGLFDLTEKPIKVAFAGAAIMGSLAYAAFKY
jgi:hypothetical protein